MIKEFIDFTHEIFPSISPYTAERAKEAITQFNNLGFTVEYLTKTPFDYICQGDVFDKVPFEKFSNDGKLTRAVLKAQVINNTCDCERNPNLTFAAIYPISDFPKNQADAIKTNITYQFMYLPDKRLEDYVIDFNQLTTLPRDLFIKAIDLNKISKIVSLSQIGFYFFISKLTVFFMRPEDLSVNETRNYQ